MSDIPPSPTTQFAATKIAGKIVCRDCLNMEEMVTAQRGITEPITNEQVEQEEMICARCNNKVEPFSPF